MEQGQARRPRRVLLVEDEYLVAEDMLYELGKLDVEVIGPVGSVGDALRRIEAEPEIDAAVLDINLCGEMVFPVADLLSRRGVPIIFMTGYDEGAIPACYARFPRCEKPVNPRLLRKTLEQTV